jgi:5-oxoprolinase (ATP-hydrolysing)
MLANRRTAPPKGICGGEDAKPGRNWVERTDGTREKLPACAAADMQTGDRMIIHTPGGAGYGRKS